MPTAIDEDSGSTPSSDPSLVAAECPAVADFQEVCGCDAVAVSWASLELGADAQLSELLTLFVEGDAESVAAAVCARALTSEDIVDSHVYPLSGRTDGSTTVALDLSEMSGLVGYSLLSGDHAQSLGFGYFVVSHDSGAASLSLQPWEEE